MADDHGGQANGADQGQPIRGTPVQTGGHTFQQAAADTLNRLHGKKHQSA